MSSAFIITVCQSSISIYVCVYSASDSMLSLYLVMMLLLTLTMWLVRGWGWEYVYHQQQPANTASVRTRSGLAVADDVSNTTSFGGAGVKLLLVSDC